VKTPPPPRPRHTDIAIATLAGAAVADYTHPLGRSARTAHRWQEILHGRAQIRAERYLRAARQ
jgi:hypothetical protein